jgi:hypothetical protein
MGIRRRVRFREMANMIWLTSGRANEVHALFATACRMRVDQSRPASPRQRGTSTLAPGHATCTKYPAASPAQSCRRRPLQLGESTSEAVGARFLAACVVLLFDYCSQVFLPTHSPLISNPHPDLTLACAATYSAAVRRHHWPPPYSATRLSLHARSYRPSGPAPAANHLSGTHARDRRHRYIHPARTQPLHYITLHRKQPARAY